MGTFILEIIAASMGVWLGYWWYGPRMYGKAWMRMVHMTPEMAERAGGNKAGYAVSGFAVLFLVAHVMSVFAAHAGEAHVGSIRLAVLLWLGVALPVLSGSVLWEHKPLTFFAINAGYWFIVLMTMSIIVGL